MKKHDKKKLDLSPTVIRSLSRELSAAELPAIVGGYINTAKQARGCP
ncbi:MAG TPA: hypothetical protein VL463_15470 [Kofleriaceae bacterium]|nr:hypothetical protein [Kofleriaceae bacterium]